MPKEPHTVYVKPRPYSREHVLRVKEDLMSEDSLIIPKAALSDSLMESLAGKALASVTRMGFLQKHHDKPLTARSVLLYLIAGIGLGIGGEIVKGLF